MRGVRTDDGDTIEVAVEAPDVVVKVQELGSHLIELFLSPAQALSLADDLTRAAEKAKR